MILVRIFLYSKRHLNRLTAVFCYNEVMIRSLAIIAFLLFLGVLGFLWFQNQFKPTSSPIPLASLRPSSTESPSGEPASESVEIVAQDLDIPWEIAFLPDGKLLVTERIGNLVIIGEDKLIHPVSGVE